VRENRQYGSEGGELVSLPYPYQEKAGGVNAYPWRRCWFLLCLTGC